MLNFARKHQRLLMISWGVFILVFAFVIARILPTLTQDQQYNLGNFAICSIMFTLILGGMAFQFLEEME